MTIVICDLAVNCKSAANDISKEKMKTPQDSLLLLPHYLDTSERNILCSIDALIGRLSFFFIEGTDEI